MVNMIDHHGHIHVPPPLHSLDLLARATWMGRWIVNHSCVLGTNIQTMPYLTSKIVRKSMVSRH